MTFIQKCILDKIFCRNFIYYVNPVKSTTKNGVSRLHQNDAICAGDFVMGCFEMSEDSY